MFYFAISTLIRMFGAWVCAGYVVEQNTQIFAIDLILQIHSKTPL